MERQHPVERMAKSVPGKTDTGSTGHHTTYIGKYGPDVPDPIPTAPLYPVGYAPHVYAQTDPDGRNEISNGPTGAIQLPGNGSAPGTSCFPYFPPGYGSNSSAERIACQNGNPISATNPISTTNPITYRNPAAYTVYKPALYTNTVYNSDVNPPLTGSSFIDPRQQ